VTSPQKRELPLVWAVMLRVLAILGDGAFAVSLPPSATATLGDKMWTPALDASLASAS
jgi:hypothetical protein